MPQLPIEKSSATIVTASETPARPHGAGQYSSGQHLLAHLDRFA